MLQGGWFFLKLIYYTQHKNTEYLHTSVLPETIYTTMNDHFYFFLVFFGFGFYVGVVGTGVNGKQLWFKVEERI